jgi:transposase-like protein
MLSCRWCTARFSERQGTPLFVSQLTAEKALSIFEHLAERNGVRATARLVKVNCNTVVRSSRLAGDHARPRHDELVAFSPQHP